MLCFLSHSVFNATCWNSVSKFTKDFWQDRLESAGEKQFNSVQRMKEGSFTNLDKRTHTSMIPFKSCKLGIRISKHLLLLVNTMPVLYCHFTLTKVKREQMRPKYKIYKVNAPKNYQTEKATLTLQKFLSCKE